MLRVRDEIRMTIAAYQTLYESSVAFGMRKALQAEQGKSDMERKVSGVDHEVSALCEFFCQSQGHRVAIPDEILASGGLRPSRQQGPLGSERLVSLVPADPSPRGRAVPVTNPPLGGSTDPDNVSLDSCA